MFAFGSSRAVVLSLALIAGAAQSEPSFMGSIAALTPGDEIVWGKTITLTPPDGAMGRYPRLVKLESGPHAGDLLMTYQTGVLRR